MDRLSGTSAAPAPVLVDVQTVAVWQGHASSGTPTASRPGKAAPEQGFVARNPAPAADALKLVDVRWSALGSGNGHAEYVQGHVPCAVYVSMEGQLSSHDSPRAGRHPLPGPGRFGEAVRMLGINQGDTVVVYDDVNGTSAARAWWLLRHAGLERTYLLDGGLSAWRAAGLPLQAGDVIPAPGDVRTSWGRMPVLDIDDAAGLPDRGLLLDARSAARYRGEEEPLDPAAGHIPGAVSAPTTDNVDDDGRFRPAVELVRRFRGLGADPRMPVGSYCGSGVTAAHQVAALNIAGYHGALFPGSWSAWSNTPGRPVATGEEP